MSNLQGQVIVWIIALWIICFPFIVADIGKRKGYSWFGFFLFGLFFSIIGLIVALILPKREKEKSVGKIEESKSEIALSEKELKRLADAYHKWSTEDLKKAITSDKDRYHPDSIVLMKKELGEREQV
jgi:Na+/melibiose symporter-like transporter